MDQKLPADEYRYFLQLCIDPENDKLANKCVLYFDKLISMWSNLGVILATQRDSDRTINPSNNLYIITRDKQTQMIVVGNNNQIVDRGSFINRISEIIGIYAQVPNNHISVANPQFIIIYQDSQVSSNKSQTFQTYSQQKDSYDARKDIVMHLALILPAFIQYHADSFLPRVKSYTQTPYILEKEQPRDQSAFVQKLNTIFNIKQLSNQARLIFNNLQNVQLRTDPRIIHTMLNLIAHNQQSQSILENVYSIIYKQKDIIIKDKRETETLLLRQLKALHHKRFGYDVQINQCTSINQLQNILPLDIYNALVKANELKQKLREQASQCTHVGYHSLDILVNQFLDLSNVNKHEIVAIYVQELQRTINIPIGYIPCNKCKYEFICGHRALYILLKDDIDQYTKIISSFTYNTPANITQCVVCGMVIQTSKLELTDDINFNKQELEQLYQKRGFKLCQKFTKSASRLIVTNLVFNDTNFIIYIYRVVYPFIKSLVIQYKHTFEYQRRLSHSVAIAVATFFYRMQDTQKILFKIQEYYSTMFNSRDISVTFEQFMQQVELLKDNEVFQSGIIAKEPGFDNIFSYLAHKPLMYKYLKQLGITNFNQLADKFGVKDKETGAIVIQPIRIYKEMFKITQFPQFFKLDYDELLSNGMLRIQVILHSLFYQSREIPESIKQSQIIQQQISVPRVMYKGPSSIRTGSMSFKSPQQLYPDSDEPYISMFYSKYCPKASYKQSNGFIDSFHQLQDDICQLCGFNSKKQEEYKPDASNIKKHFTVMQQFKPLQLSYQIKIPLNTNVIEAIQKLYNQYNVNDFTQISKKYAVNSQQLVHMGMYDYIGYEYGLHLMVQSQELIQSVLQFQSNKYNKSFQVSIKNMPKDLEFIKNHHIDWTMFKSRWNRVQGFLRDMMFKVQLPDQMLASFSLLVRYMTTIHKNYYIHTQMLLYYYFCVLLPAIADINAHDILVKLIEDMCRKDQITSLKSFNTHHFAQNVQQDRDMRIHNDDKLSNQDVIGEDEQADELP